MLFDWHNLFFPFSIAAFLIFFSIYINKFLWQRRSSADNLYKMIKKVEDKLIEI